MNADCKWNGEISSRLGSGDPAMAAENRQQHPLRNSLLTSLAIHLSAVLLLAMLSRTGGLGFGRGGTLALVAETAEDVPQPEMLLADELAIPSAAADNPATEDGQLAPSDQVAMDVVAPDLQEIDRATHNDGDDGHDPMAAHPNSRIGGSFFGLTAKGHRFVYVIDISPSMNIGSGKGPRQVSRLIRAFAELRASIGRLSSQELFYVILFSGKTRRMFDEQTTALRFLPATTANKLRLESWLAGVRTDESTDPRQALRLGLALEPNALFLLSDGKFNVPEATILELIAQHDREGTPIYTVAYEDSASCQTMQLIAQLTGGEYQFIHVPAR